MDLEHVGRPDHLEKPAPQRRDWAAVARACDTTPGDWWRVLHDYPTSSPAQQVNNGDRPALPPHLYQARTTNSGRTPTGRPLYDVYVRRHAPLDPTAVRSTRDRGSHTGETS